MEVGRQAHRAAQAEEHALAGPHFLVGGTARVFGQDVGTLSARRRDRLSTMVGYLAQDDGERLSPDLTVGEAIAGREHRDPQPRGAAALHALDLVAVGDDQREQVTALIDELAAKRAGKDAA
jgi:ABC-type uncharacterized transport system ATPase component